MTETFQEDEILGKAYDGRLVRRLLVYAGPYRRLLAVAFLLAPLMVAMELAGPKIIQLAVDQGVKQGDYAAVGRYCVFFVIVLTLVAALQFLQRYLTACVSQGAVNDLRAGMFAHLQALPLRFFDRNPVGRLLTRISSDVESLNEFYSQCLVTLMFDFLLVIGIMIWMVRENHRLALASFTVLPAIIYFTWFFKQRTRDTFRAHRIALARLNSYWQENLSGMKVVQMFRRERRNAGEMAELNRAYLQNNVRMVFYFAAFFPAIEILSSAALAILIGYSAHLIGRGDIQYGMLFQFVFLTQKLFSPIRDIADKYAVMQTAMASAERVFHILDEPRTIHDAPAALKLEEFRGHIEFRNVWFAYEGENWVLKNVSFVIQPGEKVALVGHTGAGKTTVTSLITRMYDVQRGDILIDGRSIREYELASLRRHVAVVLQDVFLFSGDVLSNIRLGNDRISNAEIEEVCKYVNADQFIRKMDKGYRSEIQERGANLSTGQRQLIAFARALAFKPSLLVLDEATSNVDTETEQLIQEALQKIIRDKNVLMIAHRLSTVEQVDRILVFRKGELAESGSHQELLRKKGLYYRLYQLQYREMELEA